ncbi:MAG: hypothetical protein HY788_16040 [Deltaproteobacteria bacterium]|nr:hypothetical protein [Deltaproteobacteria bacterium]
MRMRNGGAMKQGDDRQPVVTVTENKRDYSKPLLILHDKLKKVTAGPVGSG